MRLDDWLATLRTAMRPLEATELSSQLAKITNRAAELSGYTSGFVVTKTARGVRIHATNPSAKARRALERAVNEVMPEVSDAAGQTLAERLIR